MFPSLKRYGLKREAWVKLLKRKTINKTSWKPFSSDRVCNEHFVDGIPTEKNPDPTLKLGYDKIEVPMRKPPKLRTFIENKSTPVTANSILISPPMSPLSASSTSCFMFNVSPSSASATSSATSSASATFSASASATFLASASSTDVAHPLLSTPLASSSFHNEH